MRSFRSLRSYFLPAHYLDDEAGGAFVWTLSALIDIATERVRTGLMARFPVYAGRSALALIGRDRQIPRGMSETDTHYASRLRAWRYPRGHRVRGSTYALIEQISSYFGALRIWGIDFNGGRYERSVAGVETSSAGNAWLWGVLVPAEWARLWIVIDASDGVFRAQPSFGSPDLWGGDFGAAGAEDYCVGLLGASPADWDAVRRLLTGQHRWLPAGMQAEWLTITLDGVEPVPNPDWELWGRTVVTDYVEARDTNCRYIALRPAMLEYAGDPTDFCSTATTPLITMAGDPTDYPSTITMPEGIAYAGSPSIFPLTITLIDDGVQP